MRTTSYITATCPNCLGSNGYPSGSACQNCQFPFPLNYVITYEEPPWEYSQETIATLRRYAGLRLMAPYRGKTPELLSQLSHVRMLYLSRYRGFEFAFLEGLSLLQWLELDFTRVTTLAGIERATSLAILALTECSTLSDISAVAGAPRLKSISLSLCNRLRDFSPVAALQSLLAFRVECSLLPSLSFLASLRAIRSLTLVARKIEDPDISPLLGLPDLRSLSIPRKYLPERLLHQLQEANPTCKIERITGL